MVSIEQIDRSGSKRKYIVTGVDRSELEPISNNVLELDDGTLRVSANNKGQARAIESLVAEKQEPAKTQQSASPRGQWSQRYVELESVATAKGLKRGRSWRCGEIDIQTKGAHPSWEGDFICYVYE